jgi:hypothetical protein
LRMKPAASFRAASHYSGSPNDTEKISDEWE